jgi:hypothetical protein
MWPLVVAKELVDNALDAVEETGTAPQVDVSVTENLIEVRDNGPGIPGDVVERVLDFTVRVSSREAYVGPTRGAQGNGICQASRQTGMGTRTGAVWTPMPRPGWRARRRCAGGGSAAGDPPAHAGRSASGPAGRTAARRGRGRTVQPILGT